MPIPLDLANLASNVVVHSEDEARLGPLDLANLNACSGPVDLQPREDGPDAGHVSEHLCTYLTLLLIGFS